MTGLRITHVITSTDVGGAETQLWRLLGHLRGSAVEAQVVSLLAPGEVGRRIAGLGVPVLSLGLGRGGTPGPAALWRLARLLRRFRPDLVQAWMYHANLAASVAAPAAGAGRSLWGIRATAVGGATLGRRTRLLVRAGAPLSHLAARRIVYNSHAGRARHEAIGYRRPAGVVIANGFDTDAFAPDPAARAAVRAELGLDDAAVLVGHVARFDPVKDHAGFIAAAGRVAALHPEARFLLCGRGVDAGNAALAAAVAAAGLAERVHLLGQRDDVARLVAAFDVACSSSLFEGFPNAVAEPMAAGVPCVVTDAGDSGLLVGDTGTVVPPGDSDRLAAALAAMLAAGPAHRSALGAAARRRVVERFSMAVAADEWLRLWRGLAGVSRRDGGAPPGS